MRRPASKIVWLAGSLGLLVIFSTALASELRKNREERRCALGELELCLSGCGRGSQPACEALARACAGGAAAACELERAAKAARSRRARW
jgi:hypothetical protein